MHDEMNTGEHEVPGFYHPRADQGLLDSEF